MAGVTEVKLSQVVGSGLCVASEDGEKVYEIIASAIKRGDRVRISFQGVEDLTSAFLNSAVGQLYGAFVDEDLKNAMLPPTEASQANLALLKRVVERARDFFRNPQRYREAAKEVLGDDEQ